jgi:methylmalonyl-CoA mutase C-terminal domain/subunit
MYNTHQFRYNTSNISVRDLLIGRHILPYHQVILSGLPLCPKDSPMSDRKIRVLVAKPGLDGHDRGAKVVARALRDAGFEVIYTGIRQTPQMIAEAALQEDVDVVGLSILSGAHMTLCPKVVDLLRAQGQEDVTVLVGGIIPDEDVAKLQAAGIRGIFGPGTSTQDIVTFIHETVE